MLTSLAAGAYLLHIRQRNNTKNGVIFTSSNRVILLPEKWVGCRFPILPYLDHGRQISSGKWTVVFFRRNCSKCDEILPKYIKRACRSESSTAFIELPVDASGPYDRRAPFTIDPRKTQAPTVMASLNNRYDWLVETPFEVTVNNGMTVSAAGADALSARMDASSDNSFVHATDSATTIK